MGFIGKQFMAALNSWGVSRRARAYHELMLQGALPKVHGQSPRQAEMLQTGLQPGTVSGLMGVTQGGDEQGALFVNREAVQASFTERAAIERAHGRDRLGDQRQAEPAQFGGEQATITRVPVAEAMRVKNGRKGLAHGKQGVPVRHERRSFRDERSHIELR
jgi:hypothetical protein